MGLSGKLVSEINIKSNGDLFYELFRQKPYEISEICPGKVQRVDLHSGQWGTVGSIVAWHFTHDGENVFSKEIIEAIDEKKKSVTYKVIDGYLKNSYDSFRFIVDVIPSNGEDNTVTWTLKFEKKTEDVPEPRTLMDVCVGVTKDIERSHMLVPN